MAANGGKLAVLNVASQLRTATPCRVNCLHKQLRPKSKHCLDLAHRSDAAPGSSQHEEPAKVGWLPGLHLLLGAGEQ